MGPERTTVLNPRWRVGAAFFAAFAAVIGIDRLSAQDLVLRADRAFDGRGGVIEPAAILVRDGKIAAIAEAVLTPPGAHVLQLSGTSLLPGFIDTHVHIDWFFDGQGRLRTRDSATIPQQMLYSAENAQRTLMAGVTTAQSLGSRFDPDLRDAIQRGVLAGPRILTSIEAISEATGDPSSIRAKVIELARNGADVIKIFASASIRDGGAPTMAQDQLDAACGQARTQGLRAVVHAHGVESARRSVLAGCTAIEHGALLDRATLELLAERGVYYDPNVDLVLRNYLENKDRFFGIGNYNEEGFAQMEAARPKTLAVFKEALTVPGLKIVFGTDAVAGAHGRNLEELVFRIEQGGQNPLAAITSATSLAAESLGLGDQIGSLVGGYAADIVAVNGDPRSNPRALLSPRLVMKGGTVFRFDFWSP